MVRTHIVHAIRLGLAPPECLFSDITHMHSERAVPQRAWRVELLKHRVLARFPASFLTLLILASSPNFTPLLSFFAKAARLRACLLLFFVLALPVFLFDRDQLRTASLFRHSRFWKPLLN
jgi:hypothetical protein